MQHTPKLEKAIQTAGSLHREQTRKGQNNLPYVTHLFSVAVLLSQYTHDEDVIIAGLLHDTIEDTEYTEEALRTDFGDRIADIVLGVTEPQGDGATKPSWDERKRGYIENLKRASKESLMVAGADKTHNFRSAIAAFSNDEASFQKLFSGDRESRTRYYGAIVETICERVENSAMEKELKGAFEEYCLFLEKAG